MTDSGFTVDVDQNQYLPEGGRDVSAVVTVTSGADVALRGSGGRRGQCRDHHHRLLGVDGLSADQDVPGPGGHRRRDRRGP